ncbi:MAG: MFS transporter [Pseudomonadales bacterium]|jgi:MFS family permease
MRHPILPILISLGIFLIGHGLQLSLLPLFARDIGWTDFAIALTGASYFLGFVVGCIVVPRQLARSGHIRVFLCAGGTAAATLLILEFSPYLWAWLLLRFITGCCLACMYTVVESWINEFGSNAHRGRLISIYIITTLVGIGIGQQMLGLMELLPLFRIGAIVMLLALLPMGLSLVEQPMMLETESPSLTMVSTLPIIASAGMVLGGIVTGSIWTLAPLVAQNSGLTPVEIGFMMNAVVVGGALAQLPLGWLSDKFNRATTMNVIAIFTVILCGIALTRPQEGMALIMLMFFLGGTSLSIYGICVSEANDKSELNRIQIATILLLLNSAGSIIGPIATGLVAIHSDKALFIVTLSSMIFLSMIITLAGRRTPKDIAAKQPENDFYGAKPG